MRSASLQTRSYKSGSAICSSDQSGDRRTRWSGSTGASATRRRAGPIPGGSSPKLSGIPASCFLALDSSSRTCVTHRRTWSAFTTGAARASNGLRKGKARPSGLDSRAARSRQYPAMARIGRLYGDPDEAQHRLNHHVSALDPTPLASPHG
jgi:hypothetical protein